MKHVYIKDCKDNTYMYGMHVLMKLVKDMYLLLTKIKLTLNSSC